MDFVVVLKSFRKANLLFKSVLMHISPYQHLTKPKCFTIQCAVKPPQRKSSVKIWNVQIRSCPGPCPCLGHAAVPYPLWHLLPTGHPGHRHVPSPAWPCLLHEPQTHITAVSLLLPAGLRTWLTTLLHLGLSVDPATVTNPPLPHQRRQTKPKLQRQQGWKTQCKESTSPVGAVMRMSLPRSLVPLDCTDFPGWGSVQPGTAWLKPVYTSATALLLGYPLCKKGYGSICGSYLCMPVESFLLPRKVLLLLDYTNHTIEATNHTLQGPLGIHGAQENPAVCEVGFHLRNIQVALWMLIATDSYHITEC